MEPSVEGYLSETQRASIARYLQQTRRIVRLFRQNREAMFGFVIVFAFVIMAVFAPVIAPYEPERSFKDDRGIPLVTEPPSANHLMGTNAYGRDILSQWILASRVSLLVGILSGISTGFIGTSVGLFAGYYKGKVDLVLMRIVDVIYGIPATPLILVVAMFYGSSVWTIVIAMILVLWRTMARVIRAQTLSIAERPFVESAKASGASDLRIMYLHIAPNLLPLIFIETTFIVAYAIALEAGISFLGIGAELSWGSMLQLTMQTGAIRHAWWWVLPPGLSIAILILSFFLISRAVEDITNPEGGGFR